jgi:hypothetical protein
MPARAPEAIRAYGCIIRRARSPTICTPTPLPRVAQMPIHPKSRHHLQLVGGAFAALLAASPATAQTAATTETHAATPTGAKDSTKAPLKEAGPKPKSVYGVNLTRAEARALLAEMQQITEKTLATSRAAEKANSVADVKAAADQVLQAAWGTTTGRGEGTTAEVKLPGWKERWQVTGAEWAPSYAKRLGTAAPKVTDPRQLGVMGRGRAVRGRLNAIVAGTIAASPAEKATAEQIAASISNVVGWTYMSEGLKGNEMQPRVSLTYVWDAPSEFWNSTSDTGWFDEVFSQAINILKTDYGTDVAEARKHAAGMTELLQKALAGLDADKNGKVEAKMMEGGLNAALAAAGTEGL